MKGLELARRLLNDIKDRPYYHCKEHGKHVAVAARKLGEILGRRSKELDILEVAGLWHDIGMLMDECLYCEDHEKVGSDCLVSLSDGDPLCCKAADVIRRSPKALAMKDIEDGVSLPELLTAADYIAQCSHPTYLLMLGKLYETFRRSNCGRGHNSDVPPTKTAMLYDTFIAKCIYPALFSLLRLKGMEEYRKGFELNMCVRKYCRQHKISYEEFDKSLRAVAGVGEQKLCWSLPITYENLSKLL